MQLHLRVTEVRHEVGSTSVTLESVTAGVEAVTRLIFKPDDGGRFHINDVYRVAMELDSTQR